jgi:hypothetical protein
MLTRGRSIEMKAKFDRSPEDCSVMDLMARGWTLRLIEVFLGAHVPIVLYSNIARK